ncbi:M81 family metallopeptidase [Bradyrhizobium manausense]|uniref:M81 family metallopeptidase n=1 Tax=Bradyrhizobium manausense TaxID=989370 RepID=UPI001BAD055C|nr:M81 family metallopeptidase [Bradyrhizobium manausense]MBR0830135.1 M81 family metallopeptidase [Bradyrhizobium manausense]
MRIFTALFGTETNTFSPLPTSIDQFMPNELPASDGKPFEYHLFGMVLRALRERALVEPLDIVQGRGGFAEPNGMTTRTAYETLRDRLLEDLRAAMPVDVVALAMHGAMIADGYEDAEGDLIAEVRRIVGPDVIIGVELDLHGFLSRKKYENADILIFFKDYPHLDILDRARELVDLCLRAARREIKPVMSILPCNMIAQFMTLREPMRSFVARMKELEGMDGVLSISFVHGFAWGDCSELGSKMLVITDGRKSQGDALAAQLRDELFAIRDRCFSEYLDIETALNEATRSSTHPIVLADVADNTGGGAAGDSTFVLEAMLRRGIAEACIGPFYDPGALAICYSAGVGARLPLRIGGKHSPASGQPLDVEARVLNCAPAPDMLNCFGSGLGTPMGRAVRIDVAGIEIVLVERRIQALGDLFTPMGLDWRSRKIVVVKSANHFYAAYAPSAAKVLFVDSPGGASMNWKELRYRHRPRNLWPMDNEGAPSATDNVRLRP